MNMKKIANVVLCIFLGAGVAGGIVVCASALSEKGLFMEGVKASADMEAVQGKVLLKHYELGHDPKHYVKAGFVVENGSEQTVKNLEVRCEFFDQEDRYCDSASWLLHGRVPAGKQMLYRSLERKFISSRAANFQCDLVDLRMVSSPKGHGHGEEDTHQTDTQHHTTGGEQAGHGKGIASDGHGDAH